MKTLDRIVANAKQLNRDYARANQILEEAVREAMPWAAPLAMRGVVPTIDKIERLATQCVAILMATDPEGFEKPVRGYKNE